MNKLVKNYMYNAIYQIFLIIVPIITAPYLARVLGANQLGIYSYISSISSILTTIGLLGLNNYGIRQIAYSQDNQMEKNKIFSEITYARLFLLIIVSLIYYLIIINSQYKPYFIIQYFLIISIFIDPSWILIGLEDMKIVVLRNFIAKILTVIGVFTLVKENSDLWIYISIFSFITFITTLSIYHYVNKYVKLQKCSLKCIIYHFKESILLFLPQIAILIYLQIDKIMIKYITTSTSQVSFYDQADKLVQIPLSLITALGLVMMPRLALEFKNKNYKAINDYINKTIIFSLFLAYPMTFGIIGICKTLIPWYLGKEFIPVISAIMIISPIIIINSLINISGTQYFTATNQIKIMTISTTLSAMLNVLINIILIPKLAYKGAAIATVVSATISFIIQYTYLNKQINVVKTMFFTLKYLIISIIMGIVVYIIGIKMSPNPITTIIQILMGIFIYFGVLYFIKDNLIIEFLNKVKKYICIILRKESKYE
ncbi:oligosaccharide flippase family protein [Clostridium perfringens]|nr:oligosaccharide flippase family protein [Clostridium perfringens]